MNAIAIEPVCARCRRSFFGSAHAASLAPTLPAIMVCSVCFRTVLADDAAATALVAQMRRDGRRADRRVDREAA